MAIDLQQGVNEQFDVQRKRAAQQEGANLQGRRDALARRAAAMGAAPGGALIKQEGVAADESARRLADANEGINAAQAGEQRRIREVLQGQEFSRGEREASQGWQSGENAIQRSFTTGEREASQGWQSGENALSRQAQFDMQKEQINAAAAEGRLNREQANIALAQAQAQFDASLGEEKRVNDWNMKQKDPLEQLLANVPGMGGIQGTKSQLGGIFQSIPGLGGLGGGGGVIKTPSAGNAISRRLGF